MTDHPPPDPRAEPLSALLDAPTALRLEIGNASDVESALSAAPLEDKVFELAESLWRPESGRRREEFGKIVLPAVHHKATGALFGSNHIEMAARAAAEELQQRTYAIFHAVKDAHASVAHRVNKMWSRETFKAWCWRQIDDEANELGTHWADSEGTQWAATRRGYVGAIAIRQSLERGRLVGLIDQHFGTLPEPLSWWHRLWK